jgi:hypothetical protein
MGGPAMKTATCAETGHRSFGRRASAQTEDPRGALRMTSFWLWDLFF